MRKLITLVGLISGISTAFASATGGGITSSGYTSLNGPLDTGAIRVIIKPAAAVHAGAKWTLLPATSYRLSRSVLGGLEPGKYTLKIKLVTGFKSPGTSPVTIKRGKLLTITYTCVPITTAGLREQALP
ncbi:MAG: hypothetical protein ABIS50_07675 [Luteolibacter sp.]|uniref:hypothetical protein n=1 Tax=Luteolibacter sp. TaxID=1962973 RepID=UPI0032654EE4